MKIYSRLNQSESIYVSVIRMHDNHVIYGHNGNERRNENIKAHHNNSLYAKEQRDVLE